MPRAITLMVFVRQIIYHKCMSMTNEKLRDKEEQIAKDRATLLRVSYTDTRNIPEESFFPDIMDIDAIDKYRIVPVAQNVQDIQLGFSLETPQTSLEEVQKLFPEFRVFFTYISQSGYNELRERYYRHAHRNDPKPPSPKEMADQLAGQILDVNEKIKQNTEINLFDEALQDAHQSELFKFLAQQAFLLDSSDIHIEPEQEGARIRFRIDGRLHVVGRLEKERYKILLNEIQMKAKVRWNADYPQTGSTTIALINHDKASTEVNMRVETVPAIHGSDIVIRLFNMQEEYLDLNNLGLNDKQHQVVSDIISRPYGLVLTVGPTGSGKSSTLYSIIKELNSNEVKIVTLEDPVEYEISGITQIPVVTDDREKDTDDAFMSRLRAVLREDPDIIMVGEIRDEETARTALQASLTGHLVLSTFHATNGAAAVSRLLDLIDYNPLLASAIRLIMPQRLVRRLCEHCKEAYTPDQRLASTITQALQGLTEQPQELTLYRAVGCDQCHNIGYKGRICVLEQFQVSQDMNDEIASNESITAHRLQELAVMDGMVTMLQDGILKALAGHTSIEEVFRVIELR